MTKYYYFVSFIYRNLDGKGFGRSEIFLYKKITSFEEIKLAEEAISSKGDYIQCSIINFQFLRKEKIES